MFDRVLNTPVLMSVYDRTFTLVNGFQLLIISAANFILGVLTES